MWIKNVEVKGSALIVDSEKVLPPRDYCMSPSDAIIIASRILAKYYFPNGIVFKYLAEFNKDLDFVRLSILVSRLELESQRALLFKDALRSYVGGSTAKCLYSLLYLFKTFKVDINPQLFTSNCALNNFKFINIESVVSLATSEEIGWIRSCNED